MLLRFVFERCVGIICNKGRGHHARQTAHIILYYFVYTYCIIILENPFTLMTSMEKNTPGFLFLFFRLELKGLVLVCIILYYNIQLYTE